MTTQSDRIPRRYFLPLLLLTAGLIVLLILSRNGDSEQFNRINVDLAHIEELEAILNEDILRVRHGHLRHYDTLNASLSQLRVLVGQVARDFGDSGSESVQALTRTLTQKQELIEHFKSEIAIYLNSAMYFPMATARMTDALEASGSGAHTKRPPLVLHTHRLLRAVLIYLRSGDSNLMAEINQHLGALDKLRDQATEPVTSNIAAVIAHARLLVESRARLESLQHALDETGLRVTTQSLRRLAQQLKAAEDTRSTWLNWGLVFYAAVLLAYVVALFVRLQMSARELAHANVMLGQEVAERRRAQTDLSEEKERAVVTLHSIGDAVMTSDAAGVIGYLNPVAEQLTGWTSAEASGRTLEEVFQVTQEATGETALPLVRRCLAEGYGAENLTHVSLASRRGKQIPIESTAAPIRDRVGVIVGAVIVFHDVSRVRELTSQLSWEATHDRLTGLANRREFEARLRRASESAASDSHEHALLYIDLDQFKLVNDTCGHVAGDELLRQLAAVLQSKVRETDVVARLGGDEFVVLLEGCPLSQARTISQQLHESVKDFRFAWEDRSFTIGVSIGLVPINASSGSEAQILANADVACYAAKEQGRNRIHVYEPDDTTLARRHGEMQWVSRMAEAFSENRFRLYSQRIVSLASRAELADRREILVRMADPAGRLVLPEEFLPAAERYNMMVRIDRWVVEQVLVRLRAAGKTRGRCHWAVNLSGLSLSDGAFLEYLRQELGRQPRGGEGLCFEITETAAIANLSSASVFIHELKEMGCEFALDDFGSGLSSFSYLKSLPVDYLKIDGGFVRDMVADPIDDAMVQAINQIGHVMGIATVAEWVEKQVTLWRLKDLGVDFAQGYAIDRPQPF